jgi:hypothetical protein
MAPRRDVHRADPPPADDPRHRLSLWLLSQLTRPKIGEPMLMHLMVGILLLLMMQGGPRLGSLLRLAFAAGRLYGQTAERLRAARGR